MYLKFNPVFAAAPFMLSNSSHTNRASTIPAPEEILSPQQYRADLQAPPTGEFPDLDSEHPNEEDQQTSSADNVSNTGDGEESEFNQLMRRQDFSEMFNEFFVTGHKKLFLLQSKILKERNIYTTTLVVPSSINVHKIETLRKHLYRLQTVFFKSPKGQQYDTV